MKKKFGGVLWMVIGFKPGSVLFIESITEHKIYTYIYRPWTSIGATYSKATWKGLTAVAIEIGWWSYFYYKYIARRKVITRQDLEKYGPNYQSA